MNNNVLIIGIVVGCVNYLFRYLPLRLRAGNPQRFQTAAAYVGWIHGVGTGVLEDAQHYYAHAAERVGLWNSMENHNFFILLKYQF